MTSDTEHFSRTAKFLHWAVAGLIVVQFVLAKLAERAEHSDQALVQLALLARHKSVGITILGLAIVRVAWRMFATAPKPIAGLPRWQAHAANASHVSLYVLLFALPISGWLMSSASAYSVSWFGLVQLPDFIAPNINAKEWLKEIHELLGYALFAIASLHILAAFKHALVDKDTVLQRISSWPSLLLFFLIVVVGIAQLARVSSKTTEAEPIGATDASNDLERELQAREVEAANTSASEAIDEATSLAAPPKKPAEIDSSADADVDSTALSAPTATASSAPTLSPPPQTTTVSATSTNVPPATIKASPKAPATPPAWQIEPSTSYIRFTADQAGAKFNGVWQSWSAKMRFAADALALSEFSVTIDTRAVDSKDKERDGTLADAEWFDSARYPTATYQAVRFSALNDGSFIAHGLLTIKGKASPVDLAFTLSAAGKQRILIGKARLDRITLGVGTGEWLDTSWVSREVYVNVRVDAVVE